MVKHDTFDPEAAYCRRGVQIPGGKVAFGERGFTKSRRASWDFRKFSKPREIISTNMYIY